MVPSGFYEELLFLQNNDSRLNPWREFYCYVDDAGRCLEMTRSELIIFEKNGNDRNILVKGGGGGGFIAIIYNLCIAINTSDNLFIIMNSNMNHLAWVLKNGLFSINLIKNASTFPLKVVGHV